MKNAKSTITRLITSIETTLPGGNDILEFPGINKDILVEGLKESYGLLTALESQKETFDVIYLKRKISDLSKECVTFLKEYSGLIFKEKKFNTFLDNIFEIRKTVKETYLLVVEGSIRSESQLSMLREDLDDIKSALQEYIDCKEKIEQSSSRVKQVEGELFEFHEKFFHGYEKIDQTLAKAKDTQERIGEYFDSISEDQTTIKETASQIIRNKLVYNKAKDRADNLIEKLDDQSHQAENLLVEIDSISSKLREQQSSIQNIIDDANRASMAGSFKKRKDELDEPIKKSACTMNLSLIATAITSGVLLYTSGIAKENFDVVGFLTKLPVIAPFIWIAWSNSQRNNYLVRIREDYAFKYAAAMAFEGYKRQVQDTDPKLQQRLLELAVENMGSNPIRLFDKQVKSSPTHELLSPVTELFNSSKKSQSSNAGSNNSSPSSNTGTDG